MNGNLFNMEKKNPNAIYAIILTAAALSPFCQLDNESEMISLF